MSKGIFYSTITVMFIVPILFFAFVYVNSLQSFSESATSKAVGDKLASFSKSVDTDLPRAVSIISRRSIEANTNYIESYGVPLDDAETRIAETMANGTVFGNSTMINNFTVTSWASILNAKGAAFGFLTNITIVSINITPMDSYHVSVGVVVTVNITDLTNTTNLYRTYDTEIPVSIEGVVDPLYMLETNGILKRVIKAPNITVYGTAAVDTSVLQEYYLQSDSGPSFLDRLEGRLSIDNAYSSIPNTIGMESFVYLPEIQANNLPVKPNQNSIDYLYFDAAVQPGQQVNNSAYTWLRMDNVQASAYGISLL